MSKYSTDMVADQTAYATKSILAAMTDSLYMQGVSTGMLDDFAGACERAAKAARRELVNRRQSDG